MRTADPETFRLVYETAPIILHAINPDGTIRFVSDRWCEFHGVSREEAIGKLSIFDFSEESKAYAAKVVPEFMRTGEARDVSYTVITPNGRREILLNASSIRDANGEILLSVAVTTDVTGQLARERQLREINETLKHLALGFAHDMGGPAGNAAGCIDAAEMLLGKMNRGEGSDSTAAQREHFVHMAREALDALRARANSVEKFVSVITGVGDLVPVDLNAAFSDGRSMANGPLTDIPVDCPVLPTVMAAPGFSGVFQNLLANAAKYADPERPLSIRVTCKRIDDVWRITVQDNGLGFDPKLARKIFRPGYRIKSVPKPGQGFGLASARQLVVASGGDIYATSKPGVGSKFTIEVPVSETTSAN